MQMKKTLIAAAAAAPLASAHFERCGTHEPSAEHQAMVKDIALDDARFKSANRFTASDVDTTLTIPLNIHAAVSSNATSSTLSKATLQKQFDVMQEVYGQYGVEFTQGALTRTADDAIATFDYTPCADGGVCGSTPAIESWWKSKRTGAYDELHLFLYEVMGGGLLGICNFPGKPGSDSNTGSQPYYLDGCHVAGSSVPGGEAPYDLGYTGVHETGHWFGLYHVFQGGCADEDFVADTPAQSTATSGCPKDGKQDSCPNKPGKDSIHNFMDYSTDVCLEEFTEDQEARLHNMFNKLRKGVN